VQIRVFLASSRIYRQNLLQQCSASGLVSANRQREFFSPFGECMKKCSIAVLFWALIACSSSSVAYAQACALRADAPVHHVVTGRDTLWRLAAQFFHYPWCWAGAWPESHDGVPFIYPGQIIAPDRAKGLLRLAGKADVTASGPITTIDVRMASSALAGMPVVPDTMWQQAPRIVAGQDGRVHLGTGDRVYVSGDLQQHTTFRVVRQMRALIDPETGRHMGDTIITLGHVTLLQAGQINEANVFIVRDATREIIAGDRLLPLAVLPVLTVAPHPPPPAFDGKVMAMSEGELYAGQYQLVVVNKGLSDHLDAGTVLGVYRTARMVRNAADNSTMRLPDAQLGTALIIHATPRVAYALMMEVREPVRVGDSLRAARE
jgi:hypothetical protein